MTTTRKEIEKAMTEAFDAHEKHRAALATAGLAKKRAREADDKIRHLRQIAVRRGLARRKRRAA